MLQEAAVSVGPGIMIFALYTRCCYLQLQMTRRLKRDERGRLRPCRLMNDFFQTTEKDKTLNASVGESVGAVFGSTPPPRRRSGVRFGICLPQGHCYSYMSKNTCTCRVVFTGWLLLEVAAPTNGRNVMTRIKSYSCRTDSSCNFLMTMSQIPIRLLMN
jgi:hypothetical protein